MRHLITRRNFTRLLTASLAWWFTPAMAQNQNPERPRRRGPGGRRPGAQNYELPAELAEYSRLSLVLGRVSDCSVTVSALPRQAMEGYYEYGTSSGQYEAKTPVLTLPAARTTETVFSQLQPDTQYYYRLHYRTVGEAEFITRPECRFHTQRAAGSTFTFSVQGDSHPERPQMSHPELYARTLLQAAAGRPDFHICMGDDFSADPVQEVNWANMDALYTLQRPFLGLVAQSAPVFLLNGNHEQASLFNYRQTDERHEVAVMAQAARNYYFPTPGPDHFYAGDPQVLKAIGQLKDYCAWTWGDALFVILDNYWQSPAQVDSAFHERNNGGGGGNGNGPEGHKNRDWWAITMGDAQYQWFKRTLEQSRAKYKFVFAHHVLGTGRGGVDVCDLYEWGGRNRRGDWEFAEQRPGWELPVHQLMVKHGVTIFFQGHDHLFCQQERDGIIYQEVPMPADHGYMTYNEDRYETGVKHPNAGHLRVTVTPEKATVEYLRSYLPGDETDGKKTGDVACRYSVKSKELHA